MSQPDVRKGMPPRRLERGTFEQRFKSAFVDPVFAPMQRELQAIANERRARAHGGGGGQAPRTIDRARRTAQGPASGIRNAH